jgi:selenide,water dikinase
MEEVLFDPQTSGGLLAAVNAETAPQAAEELRALGLPAQIVGEITEKTDTEITVI